MGKRKTLAAPARRKPPQGRARGGGDARFQRLIRLSTGFYWESDAAHRFTFVVHGPTHVSTQAPDSQIGKTRWEIPSTRPDAAGWDAHKAALDAHLAFRDFGFARVGPDGAERQFVVSGEPVFDAKGRFTGYCGIGDDVTEREREQEALRMAEERYRTLVELSPDGIVLHDMGIIQYANASAARLFGADSPDALLGRSLYDLIDPAFRDAARQRAIALLQQGVEAVPFVERRFLRLDGTAITVEVAGVAIRRGGKAVVQTVLRDISARKRAEQLLALEHTVGRRLADADNAAEALKAVIRAVCETENWEFGRYFRVDEKAGVTRFVESWCVPGEANQEFIEKSREIAYGPGVGLTGKVWQSGQALWVSDIHQDTRATQAVFTQDSGIHGAFVFPVKFEGKTIGVLAFNSREIREPDERLLRAAGVIGIQIGQFLQRKQAEEALRESEARFRSLTEMSSDWYWEQDRELRLSFHSNSFARRSGTTSDKLLGKRRWEEPNRFPLSCTWDEHRATLEAHQPFRNFEYVRISDDGTQYFVSLSGVPIFDAAGNFNGYRGVGTNITDLVQARERVSQLAYTDPLTGLANRTSFGPALEHAVQLARRHDRKLAIMFLDLDGFKQINDAHGHDTGDRLLIEVASRLRACLRSSDLVARLGGDEFVVMLEDVQDTDQVEAVACKIVAEIARPYVLGAGEESCVSASLGISMLPDDAGEPPTLMKHADTAMYNAKQCGKNSYRFFAGESADSTTEDAGV